jgi:hypothetical protein
MISKQTIAGGGALPDITPAAIQRYLDKRVPPEDHERVGKEIMEKAAEARAAVESAASDVTAAATHPGGRSEWSEEEREVLARQIVRGLVLAMSAKEMVAVTDRAHQIAQAIEVNSRKKNHPGFAMEVDTLIAVLGLEWGGKKVDFILPLVFDKIRESRPGLNGVKNSTLRRRYYAAKAPPKEKTPKRSNGKKRLNSKAVQKKR